MLTPLDARVAIQPDEAKAQSEGGIVIPESAQERPSKGKVLSVGRGRLLNNGQRADMQVSEGDVVLFSRYSGDKVEFEGEEVLILEEDQILAVLE